VTNTQGEGRQSSKVHKVVKLNKVPKSVSDWNTELVPS